MFLTILLIVLIVLALGGFGYGYYSVPVGGAPAGWVNPMGVVGLILVILLILMLTTGWRWAP
jgi:hypothetical protein